MDVGDMGAPTTCSGTCEGRVTELWVTPRSQEANYSLASPHFSHSPPAPALPPDERLIRGIGCMKSDEDVWISRGPKVSQPDESGPDPPKGLARRRGKVRARR